MTRILYLDTTTNRLMLGLSDEQTMLAQWTAPCESHRYHSAMLIPAIQDLLKEAELSIQELTALAVNLGPGSFTGIRTGITTVRTLGQFLNVTIYGFNMFEILAANQTENGQTEDMAIYLDALRLRTYHAALRFSADGPVYQQVPVLQTLSPEKNIAPADCQLLIAPTLAPLFPEQQPELISEVFTPDVMLQLIQQYGAHFQKQWQDIKPFYLQAPSITIKQPKSEASKLER